MARTLTPVLRHRGNNGSYRPPLRPLALTIACAGFVGIVSLAAAAPPKHKKAAGSSAGAIHSSAPVAGIALQPAAATLDGSYSFQTLVVVGTAPDGSARDLTENATFASSNPGVVRIGKDNVAYPVSDGTAEVTASVGGHTSRTKLVVKNTKTNANLSFETAITPILVKNGCAGSACHGAPEGQGKFKISFFGYEAKKDWETIVKGEGGRRVNLSDPMQSLVLRKPAGLTGHVGGRRFAPDGPEARVFAAWLKAGAPFESKAVQQARAAQNGPQLAGYAKGPTIPMIRIAALNVTPGERLIRDANSKHQLIVMAKYTDGSERDVTPFSRFACDDDGIAVVNATGKLTALRRGEANVMVRFAGKVGLASVVVQPQPAMANYPKTPTSNFIDEHVFAKLKTLNMVPSELCDDATFIRRVYFDIIGTPPNKNMTRDFIEDKDPKKRKKLIDTLLEDARYKNYQTILWADLLRINSQVLKEDGVKAYMSFLRDSFADNKPFDKFVKEIITGTGSTYHNETGTANYYRVTSDPAELTTSTSQIFMSVRLECCRCHNHPFDRWSQDDFYGMAAFFGKTQQRPGDAKDEVIIYTSDNGEVRHLRTQQVMEPKILTDDKPLANQNGDLRVKLANWITARDNPFFAKSSVNRIWKQFFGRGIVHPVDDFRATNPPINAPLLDALAKDFVESGYDLKHLIRTICNSRTYQLSSTPNSTNADDHKNFAYYYLKRLGPEQLLDSVSEATGVEENFPGTRPGTRAIDLLDNNVPSGFLDVFGRSRRILSQERSSETSISQALALMNSGTINGKITDPKGRIAELVGRLGDRSNKAILDDIYLAAFARYPTEKERKQSLDYIAKTPTPKEGFEDLMWAMLNTREFLFNH